MALAGIGQIDEPDRHGERTQQHDEARGDGAGDGDGLEGAAQGVHTRA